MIHQTAKTLGRHLSLWVSGLCWMGVLSVASNAMASDAGEDRWTLKTQGEARVRYETLDNQFRGGRDGDDQLLLFRTLFGVEAQRGQFAFGVELQDSRTYLGDAGTPLSNSIANPLDVLQLYARAEGLPGLLGPNSSSRLTLGRQTVSIGSKRQIERIEFANVIKSYTGAYWVSKADRGDELHLLYVVPTARYPSSRPELDDNALSGDEEQWGRRIWAVHYRRADMLPQTVSDLWGELFVYGLEEEDRASTPTPNRSYVAPGFRVYRAPTVGRWDMDVEASLRRGERRATSSAQDTFDLDVNAEMAFAAIGYTFDHPWRPRLALEFYHASGDEDPNDGVFGQHERLFGSRRGDLNNTSIHGPLTPANLNAPGVRLQIKPHPRWDARAYYHAAFLDSPTDAWVVAGLRDPQGQSGDFIGHTLDGRVRYWVVPDVARLEIGASALIYGEFAKSVPGGPDGSRTLFGFTQMTVSF